MRWTKARANLASPHRTRAKNKAGSRKHGRFGVPPRPAPIVICDPCWHTVEINRTTDRVELCSTQPRPRWCGLPNTPLYDHKKLWSTRSTHLACMTTTSSCHTYAISISCTPLLAQHPICGVLLLSPETESHWHFAVVRQLQGRKAIASRCRGR
jgi:hypothetical protein